MEAGLRWAVGEMSSGSVAGPRWGILGTANIARGAFLPAVREAGATPTLVGGREKARAQAFAADHGVTRAVEGYEAVLLAPDVDAVYVALPNSLHAEWTVKALEAGKTVLCEKPLCVTPEETVHVLDAARRTGSLLWEAFVFPFHPQLRLVERLLAEGTIGELREIQSTFHFTVSKPENIRLSAALGGGALNDVGCYPVRLARHLFADEPEEAWAAGDWGAPLASGASPSLDGGVEMELWGSLGFAQGRRLLLSCGFRRAYDTFTRLLGSTGQIHIQNPFHPRPGDGITVHPAGISEQPTADQYSFTAALRHIGGVLAGSEEPRFLALDTALGTSQALADLAASAERQRPSPG